MADPPVILTVDCVLLTLGAPPGPAGLLVALLVRPDPPFAGVPGLPGGYVHTGEDADLAAAARRVLGVKLSLDAGGAFLEQLETVSGPGRDPRGWSASVVHYALMPQARLAGARGAVLAPVDALPRLAFDHAALVGRAVERLRAKTGYSNLPGFLLPESFTLPELQDVYERLLGRPIDQSVFRRRMGETGLIEPAADGLRRGGRHRPAQLYRLRDAKAALRDRAIAQRPRGSGAARDP